MPKERVDVLLVSRGLAPSRTRARALIETGKVLVAGVPARKASELIDNASELVVSEPDHPYVSRGGLKLEGALEDLQVDPARLVIADIGASTGGFTDCLLRRGAVRAYAVDVGHSQLADSLRNDARVVWFEHTNARYLTAQSLPELVDLVVVDASFISLTKLLGPLTTLMKPGARLLALVKPQFEVGPDNVGRHGVVESDALRARALADVIACATNLGLQCVAHADSRLTGPEGNREIFLLLVSTR